MEIGVTSFKTVVSEASLSRRILKKIDFWRSNRFVINRFRIDVILQFSEYFQNFEVSRIFATRDPICGEKNNGLEIPIHYIRTQLATQQTPA